MASAINANSVSQSNNSLALSPGSTFVSVCTRERRGGWDPKSRDLGGPYTRVGRVADRENCTWANAIFEHSGSTRVKILKTMTITEDSTVLEGLVEPRLIN